ncbi:asparaginase domain-containing protein [Polyangium fumosum]|uniref:asparaginase domain-containing protein n=1 Tax=Polyangium fumosum TaxID=889272 RepID=UPI0014785223|nr:asparaginase domain-containing protein [Polyangium fumosum]
MKIAVINTGGTISCVGNPLGPMTASDFASACETIMNPILLQKFPGLRIDYITDLVFPESKSGTLDSTNLQPTDWCLLGAYILNHYADYDGWVVLHGTDSMDFTGTALPFLLSCFDARGVATAALSKPIVITGSQVPMFYQDPTTKALSLNYNTDAFQNFCGAVASAQTGIPEVCVYFDSNLFRGSRVLKTNASEFDAFSSPNYPALGQYGVAFTLHADNVQPPPVSFAVSLDNTTARSAAIAQLADIQACINAFPVMQFNAFPGWYNTSNSTAILANLITACVGQGIKALILESYGEGNFPSGNPDTPSAGAIYKALDQANEAGVVILDCTQVIRGVVNDSAYAAGAWLPAVGALSPADMTPTAAFAKVMVLLAAAKHNGWSLADVKQLTQLDLLGEMMSVSRLDSRSNAALLAGQSISALDGSATLSNDPARGPILTTSTGAVLWTALSSPPPDEMPGRLVMQDDGNLVFYGRYNGALWATNTGDARGASSLLILGGSTSDESLYLQVYDYSANTATITLYQQANADIEKGRPMKSSSTPRRFKFSGIAAPEDTRHRITFAALGGPAPDEHQIAPTTVNVTITSPPPTRVIGVPQYAKTVRGTSNSYNPAGDCDGSFMSSRFQPNNNCYAYGCNIATNTFPQPGRASGNLLTLDTLDGATVAAYATKDGLIEVGKDMASLFAFASSRKGTQGALDGHFVALMISPPGDANWPGDYHWARCDDNVEFRSWSQKDGNDQVTNFDFAGNPIRDPAKANWQVNQGPIQPDKTAPDYNPNDLIVEYAFYCYMFVPNTGVNIL